MAGPGSLSSALSRQPWRWPLFVLALSVVATLAAWQYEMERSKLLAQERFDRTTVLIATEIREAMTAYAEALRGAAGLFQASGPVSRDAWVRYLQVLKLASSRPGIQGVSYATVLRSQAEVAEHEHLVRDAGISNYTVRPLDGKQDLIIAVDRIEPMDWRNQRALGFNLYSETTRKGALDRAITTGEPVISGKLTLVQETTEESAEEVQVGVLMVLPLYREGAPADTPAERRAAVTGFVTSPFRMRDLVQGILSRWHRGAEQLARLEIYDGDARDRDNLLYESPTGATALARYAAATSIPLYERQWLIRATSTPAFEAQSASKSPLLVALAGLAFSGVLSALAWSMIRQVQESRRSEQKIKLLLHEINHRSKNMLGVVQVVARNTAVSSPEDFVERFSDRISAMAANQDLLVKNDWQGADFAELVRAQLAHIKDMIGTRIVLQGEPMRLSAHAAQTIGMILHELATNAGKYGALSNATGLVTIAWQSAPTTDDGDERFAMSWIERGGPPVVAPTRRGFGTKVIDELARYEISADVRVGFSPIGFEWHLVCPAKLVRDRG
jgi:two-component sensor histidine kinase/CHASE1-domain containing sensor protein